MINWIVKVYLCVLFFSIQNVCSQSTASQVEENFYIDALNNNANKDLAQREYDNYIFARAFLEVSLNVELKKAEELLQRTDITDAQKSLLQIQIDQVEKYKTEGSNSMRQLVLTNFTEFLWTLVTTLGGTQNSTPTSVVAETQTRKPLLINFLSPPQPPQPPQYFVMPPKHRRFPSRRLF